MNRFRRWQTVVVSPHFDDAALSVGGLLGRFPGSTAVVTVHGGAPPSGLPVSDWDADCGFVAPLEAFCARLAEDARACALLGVDQVALPHADGPYRNGEPLDALSEFLGALHADTEVFLPLGTNQPDHAVVRTTALQALALRPGLRPRIYADLPYTMVVDGWGSATVDDALATADSGGAYRSLRDAYGLERLYAVTLDAHEWPRKRDAIFCYASQLGPAACMTETREVGELLRYPGPLMHEVVWKLGSGRD